MKTLTKLALAVITLCTGMAADAQTVRGYIRSNGTYVAPYYRTPANGNPYDNLSYRYSTPIYSSYNYSTVSSAPSYRDDTSYGSYSGSYSVSGSSTQIGGTTFHNYYSSEGGGISGTTLTIGNTSFTSLYGW